MAAMTARKRGHDFGPAILKYLGSPESRKRGRTLPEIVTKLGAQDAWDRVQHALQRLRYHDAIIFTSKRWWIT